MTSVEFHTGIDDPAGFACRLLRKAYRLGSRVQVTAPEAVLAEIDRALWVQDERDFVPHVRMPGASVAVLRRTPLWLALRPQVVPGVDAPGVLLNVGADLDLGADGGALPYDRLIEVVAAEPELAQAGRARWRRYKALGLEVVHRTPG